MITKQRVTIKDIAKQAGISHQAVSYILNDKPNMVGAKTREKVLRLVKEMGYIPNHQARSLKTNRSGFIGAYSVRIPGGHPYLADVHQNLAAELGTMGMHSARLGEFTDVDEALRLYRSKQVDAFIYVLMAGNLDAFIHGVAPELTAQGVPFVLVHGTSSIPMAFANVGFDNRAAAYAGTRHLAENGYARIGYVSRFTVHPVPVEEAIEGHLDALSDYGLTCNSDNIFDRDDFTAGYDAVRSMHAAAPGPFALNCFNDEIALAAVKAAGELGLVVGSDVGLVAGGPVLVNPEVLHMMAGCTVTRVGQDVRARAAAAVRMLALQLDDPETVQRVTGAPVLVPGKSSARPAV